MDELRWLLWLNSPQGAPAPLWFQLYVEHRYAAWQLAGSPNPIAWWYAGERRKR